MRTKSNGERDIPFITSSILNSYLQCKYSFYEQYIVNDGFKSYRHDEDGEAIYLTFGTMMHETIEDFWGSTEARTINLLLKLYESKIEKFAFTDRSYIKLGYEMVHNFFDYLLHKAPKRKGVASELSFKVKLKGVPLHGTIDRVWYLGNGIYEIEDYKTSKWMPTQDEVDDNIQLSMYDLVFSSKVMERYWYKGIKPKAILLSLHFLRYGEVIHTERTEEQRAFTLNYFRMMYNQMRRLDDSKFVPCPNNLCTFCDSETCPYYQSVLDASDSDETKTMKQGYDLSDVAEQIAYHNELASRIKILNAEADSVYGEICAALKESESVVKVGDTEYFMGQSGSRFVNVDRAVKILQAHDLWEPMDFIGSLPIGKLERMLRDYPDVWEELERKAIVFHYKNPQLKTRKAKRKGLF